MVAYEPRAHLFFSVLMSGFLAATVLTSVSTARADEPRKVSGKLFGKPMDATNPDGKKSKDVSGIACATTTGFPRLCLIADDESQGTQIVILKDGALIAGDFIRLIHDVHDDEPLELDAEAVAYADGAFYVIGSHGRPRHEKTAEEEAKKAAKNDAKAAASKHLFRVRFGAGSVDMKTGKLAGGPDIKPADLSKAIKGETKIEPHFDKPLEENGLTIEGLAVRGGTLYAGMRGPVLADGSAAVLSVPLDTLFEDKAGEAHVLPVMLGNDTRNKPRGVRDMVAYGANFLVLAGPENDPSDDAVRAGDYAIYSWNGTGTRAERLRDLGKYDKAVKP